MAGGTSIAFTDSPFEATCPKYESVSAAAFATDLLEFVRHGGKVSWDQVEELVHDATVLLGSERTLVRVSVPENGHVTVVGDLHGQLFDLLTIFSENGLPGPGNPFIFNGDFVDRGSFSVEVLLVLLALKVAYPDDVHLSRGNHEAHAMNVPYGFTGEVLTKLGMEAYLAFEGAFTRLPLAHLVNDDVFVVHGGLPREVDTKISDVESLDRVGSSESLLFRDLLWSDPRAHNGVAPSLRGEGLVTFGPDITRHFLEANHLSLVIRSHELKDDGFEWTHEGCLTVFSAPNYCDMCGNLGSTVRLTAAQGGGFMKVDIRTFDAVPRPEFYVRSMAYSPMNRRCADYLTPSAMENLFAFYRGTQ